MASHQEHTHLGKELWFGAVLTLLLAITEIILLIFTNSLAGFFDIGHNLLDVLALVLSAYAHTLSRKDQKVTWYRVAEPIGSLVSVGLLLAWNATTASQAVGRFTDGVTVIGEPLITFGVISAPVNLWIAYRLHRHGKQNSNALAAALHLVGDGMGSFGLIVAGVLVSYTGQPEWDAIVALILSSAMSVLSLWVAFGAIRSLSARWKA